MDIRISRIVSTESYDKYDSPVKTPYVVLLDIEGYEFPFDVWQKSFSSIEDAKTFTEEYLKTFKYDAVLVLRNSDFSEGSGPMTFDKLFHSVDEAEKYIAEQSGIGGGKQYRSIRFGMNIYGDGYVSVDRNGYSIKLVSFSD